MISKLHELKKRFLPASAVALTLETERIAVSIAEPEGAGRELTSIPIGADAIVSDPEKAGKELALALEVAGIRERRCVVCVPPEWALTASTELPEMEADDLRGFLELRAEREFPIALDEMRIAHLPYSLPDGTRRTTLAAIPLKRIQAVDTMLATAGCRAVSLSLALEGCLAAEPKPALHFLANGTHTNVIVTAGGGVVAMRLLASPGPEEGAPFDAAAFYREIRITLGRLPEAVRQQVREAYFGGTPASAQRLRAATSDQLLGLGIESVKADEKSAPQKAAVQAAQRYLEKQPVAFEFVVPEVKQWEVWLKRLELQKRRKLVLAVAAVIAVPLLAIFVRGRIEGYYQGRWDGMAEKVAELDALQQKIHKYQGWFDPTSVTLKTEENLIAAFPEQGDVWAKTIHITNDGKVTCTGFAKSQPALMAMIDRLLKQPGVSAVQLSQLRGDNPIQFSFTYKYNPHQ